MNNLFKACISKGNQEISHEVRTMRPAHFVTPDTPEDC